MTGAAAGDAQLGLPGLAPREPRPDLPPGFELRPELLDAGEEAELLRRLGDLSLGEFRMHGVAARRRVAHFGFGYGADRRTLEEGPPVPRFLLPLRDRCAVVAGVPPERFEEALVTLYPPGAGIGWHRDAPQFGTVAGVSLLSPCRFKLRREVDGGYEVRELALAPRSGYVLSGAARWTWQHGIPPVKAPRWSVTFRTVRAPSRTPDARGGASGPRAR